MYLNTN